MSRHSRGTVEEPSRNNRCQVSISRNSRGTVEERSRYDRITSNALRIYDLLMFIKENTRKKQF